MCRKDLKWPKFFVNFEKTNNVVSILIDFSRSRCIHRTCSNMKWHTHNSLDFWFLQFIKVARINEICKNIQPNSSRDCSSKFATGLRNMVFGKISIFDAMKLILKHYHLPLCLLIWPRFMRKGPKLWIFFYRPILSPVAN